MLIERQLSVAMVGVGLAVTLPPILARYDDTDFALGLSPLVGTAIGLIGLLLAFGMTWTLEGWPRRLRLWAWMVAATMFFVSMGAYGYWESNVALKLLAGTFCTAIVLVPWVSYRIWGQDSS